MRAYIVRRLLLVIPTLFLVSVLVFFVIRFIPGDVIDKMAEGKAFYMKTTREAIERDLGLDVPVHVQYGRWLGVVRDKDGSFNGIFQGSLGNSLWTKTSVVDLIVDRLPVSVELGILATLVTLIVAIPLGVYSAMRQDSVGDYVGRSFATLLYTLPYFWVGIIIILLASLFLGLSPELRVISFTKDPMGNLGQFIVPALVLGMAGTGTTMRMTRSMMLEVLRQDYIRTAWAKGLGERVVVITHALKNALIPVVTLMGLRLSVVVGGTVIIESIFSLPGMGRLLVQAVLDRDYTVVSGVVFFFAGFMVLVNVVVDLTYAYLDPRIRYK